MENSTSTTTSVTPPKPTLASITSKDHSIGIRNEYPAVLHNPYDLGQASNLHAQYLEDNQYQESSRNFRLQAELLPEPLLELHEHGYNLPLAEQHSSNGFYYGPCYNHDGSMENSLPPLSVSNPQFIPLMPANAMEVDNDFLISRNHHELREKFGIRDLKLTQDSFQRGVESAYVEKGSEKTLNEVRDSAKVSPSANLNVSVQLPGIETFSSSVSSTLLSSASVIPQESTPLKGEKLPSLIPLKTTSMNTNGVFHKQTEASVDSKIPYPVVKEDIPFLISNNLEETEQKCMPTIDATTIISGRNSSMIHNSPINALPKYPCTPSPTKCNAYPSVHPPLPINYRPLLENLRPIRRTEEIVRLRNDGGKITIVETTDDPGRCLLHAHLSY